MSEARPASLGHKLQDIQKVLFFPRQLFSRPFTVTENNSHKLHWILNLRVLKYEVFVLNSLGSYFQWESWTLHIYVHIIVSSSFLTKIFSLFKWLFFSNRARYRKVEKKKKKKDVLRNGCWTDDWVYAQDRGCLCQPFSKSVQNWAYTKSCPTLSWTFRSMISNMRTHKC